MSDQEPDPGEAPPAATPEPQSEPGAGETGGFADTASTTAPTQFATGPGQQENIPTSVGNGGGQRGRRRVVWAVGLGLGYVVLAAGTAFGVIIDKSPSAVDVTAVNASAYAAPAGSATATSLSTKGATASASPTTAPTTASPTPTPTPTSTVTGSVSDGTHSGDLRFFLLSPPQGPSSVQGDPDGTSETLDEAVAAYGGNSSQPAILESMGFKAACSRTYQDSTMGANVTIQLIRFKSAYDAEQWEDTFSVNGAGFAHISVPGVSGAQGWSYAKSGDYSLIGNYREGDTFFQVQIFGTQAVPAADLGQVISAQHARLEHG